MTSIPMPSAENHNHTLAKMRSSGRAALLTFDLFDRSSEPFPSRDQPESHGIRDDDPNCHDSIVQCLGIDRVNLWKDEGDGDEYDP